ncbi:MAG: orotate phosphoribosyltransferase [Nitrospirae bacterium]|nr:orotate phosphoribosyltransferase [Nitrospirota bacterium]
MDKINKLIELIKLNSYKRSDDRIFKLASGKMSSFYFNLKKTTYTAEGQYLTGSLFFDKITELNLKIDAIGGLTMGADPIAAATAYTSYLKGAPINAVVIRKEPKDHGTMLRVEGNFREGDKIVVVDDVITTGGSTIRAVKAAREAGLLVVAAIVLLDRCEENGKQNIEEMGLPVYSILDINDFR